MEEFNPNLLSKEQLCEIIERKDKKIESLERSNFSKNINNCIYWQVACIFITLPTIIVCFNLSYSLRQTQIIYGYFIIGVIASVYSAYKAFRFKIYAMDKEKESVIEKEIFVEDLSTDKLKDELESAIEEEDYNYASILRDELKQRA